MNRGSLNRREFRVFFFSFVVYVFNIQAVLYLFIFDSINPCVAPDKTRKGARTATTQYDFRTEFSQCSVRSCFVHCFFFFFSVAAKNTRIVNCVLALCATRNPSFFIRVDSKHEPNLIVLSLLLSRVNFSLRFFFSFFAVLVVYLAFGNCIRFIVSFLLHFSVD